MERAHGQPVDPTLHLIPPVYSDCGRNLRIGRNVFVNQGCRLDDIGGIELGDDVMLGPGARLISSGHPLDPARRRRQVTTAPIVVGRNVWIGAGATILQGVTIGDDAVVAASAVVTGDVPPAVLVAGIPARIVKSVDEGSRPPSPRQGMNRLAWMDRPTVRVIRRIYTDRPSGTEPGVRRSRTSPPRPPIPGPR